MKIVPKGICLNLFGFFLTQDKSWIDRYVINHELIHSAQQKELLWIPFYIVYLAEWLLRLYQYGGETGKIIGDIAGGGIGAGATVYGKFLGNNFANLGRYTLDNLTPASYGLRNWLTLPKIWIKPLYSKPPTFYNGRKPLWYNNYAKIYGTQAAENRFQNGAIWAGIPEEEIPRTMYVRNSDGTYRMTKEGLNLNPDGSLKGPLPYGIDPGNSENFPDFFTKGGIGGLHSDFTNLGNYERTPFDLIQFKDVQKLNPQWYFTKPFKILPETSAIRKYVEKMGGQSFDWMLGYKPFTIKQLYLKPKLGIEAPSIPILSDPNTLWMFPI